jgi:hypothetical protein
MELDVITLVESTYQVSVRDDQDLRGLRFARHRAMHSMRFGARLANLILPPEPVEPLHRPRWR